MAKRLLDAGTDVNLAAVNGVTPLMAAAYGGQADIVALLLDAGPNPHAVDRLKKNAMTYAAGEGRTAIVLLLLKRGASIPTASTTTTSPRSCGRPATARPRRSKALLAAGRAADLNDNRGKTALDIARETGHAALARGWRPSRRKPDPAPRARRGSGRARSGHHRAAAARRGRRARAAARRRRAAAPRRPGPSSPRGAARSADP